MAYHAVIRDAGNMVVGTAGPNAIAEAALGHTLKEITKLRFDTLNAKGITVKDGRYRYLWDQATGEAIEAVLGLMVYLVVYDNATGNTTGSRNGLPWSKADKADFVFIAGPGLSVYQATEAEFEALGPESFPGTSVRRWKIINDQLVAQIDTRSILRFTPPLVEVPVGTTPAPTVEVAVVDENGDVRTNVNVTRELLTESGRRVSVTIVNGLGSFTVPTGKERRDAIGPHPDYQVVTTFKADVFGTEVV